MRKQLSICDRFDLKAEHASVGFAEPGADQVHRFAPAVHHVSQLTASENVTKAAAVDTRMMRAMRPLSAPKRSASKETLLVQWQSV